MKTYVDRNTLWAINHRAAALAEQAGDCVRAARSLDLSDRVYAAPVAVAALRKAAAKTLWRARCHDRAVAHAAYRWTLCAA